MTINLGTGASLKLQSSPLYDVRVNNLVSYTGDKGEVIMGSWGIGAIKNNGYAMGSWGISAIENDGGMDAIDTLAELYLPDNTTIKLEEMIDVLIKDDMLTNDSKEIDATYDLSAMALAELYLEWLDIGKLEYDIKGENFWGRVSAFSANKAAIEFLLRYLHDIRNEVSTEDGNRGIVVAWRKSAHWEEWSNHLDSLIRRMEEERQKYEKQTL